MMTGEEKPLDNNALTQRLDVNFALQAAGLGAWEIDPSTNLVFWDERCRALVGLDKDNRMPFEQAVQYIHPDDLTRVLVSFQWAMKPESGGFFDETYRTLGADEGKLRWVRFWGQGYFTPAGELYRFSGVAQEVTQQLKAQQDLAESEAHLQLLRDTVPAMIFYLDVEQRYRSYNGVFREWFGVNATEVIGKTVRDFLGEQAYQNVMPHLAVAYAGQQEQYEMHAPSKMDGDRWLNIVYTPHKNGQGEVIGVIVHSTDVTPSKLAEMELRQSEARFRALIEEAPVSTCLFVGPDMIIDVVNEVMLGYWGRDKSVIGKPLAEAIPELKGQPHLQILEEVFRTGKTYEARQIRADLLVEGALKTYYFDLIHKPLRNADGQVYGIMDMSMDVTEQVLARQQVEQSEATLRNAIELAELSTWSMDIATGQMTYSERLQNWLGVKEAVLGREASPRVHFKDRDRISLAIKKALEKGGLGRYEEIYTITNALTGQERIIHASGQTVFDTVGIPLFLSGTAQDVTLQQQLQLALSNEVQVRTEELAVVNEELAAVNEELLAQNEEYIAINDKLEDLNSDLRRSNQNLEQFAYIASHDLQEPLRKIQQFSNLLTIQYGNQLGDGVDLLQRMQSAAGRMSTLVRDLLTYSRIATQRETSQTVSLTDVVNTVLTDLDLRIQETGATIEVDSMPTVMGNSSQLGQLFHNLLTNALKFSRRDESGKSISPLVRVKASLVRAQGLPSSVKPNRAVEVYHSIEVVDNGIGFEEKYLDRIFQVFQRLHGKNEFAGTGIGLAICEKVVANHGGAITASSSPGQGATFSVYLPA